MLILFYILVYTILIHGRIVIKDAGVSTLNRGDVGMIFYVTLENTEQEPYRVYVKMLNCVELITASDKDCSYMTLMGGDMGILNSKCPRNITLLYPNMYLHNRKGECTVSVIHLNAQKEAFETKATINFNTVISANHPHPVLSEYYNSKEIKKCETADLDPLESCQPVNCLMKYLGSRNYFNYKWKRCQKVPLCISDPEKELPDVAYIPVSNKCRDLEESLGKDDLAYLQQGKIEEQYWDRSNFPFLMENIRCHHGKIDNQTGFCVCDDGWMSAPFDKDQYEPSLSLYHMCSIEVGTWNGVNKDKVKMTFLIIGLTAVSSAMLILILSFCMNLLYKCIRSFESDTICVSCPYENKKGGSKEKFNSTHNKSSYDEISTKNNKSSFANKYESFSVSVSVPYINKKENSGSKTVKKTSIVKTKYESDEPLKFNDSEIQSKEIIIIDETVESTRIESPSEDSFKSPTNTSTPMKASKTKSIQSTTGTGSKRVIKKRSGSADI